MLYCNIYDFFGLEVFLGEIVAEHGHHRLAPYRHNLVFEFSALEAYKAIGHGVVLPGGYVLAYEPDKVLQRHDGAGHDKVEVFADDLGACPLGGDVGQAYGMYDFVTDAYLLAYAVDEVKMYVGVHDGKWYTGKPAAASEVHDAAARHEANEPGYGKRVQDMVLVEVVDILAGDDVDPGVPVTIECVQLTKLCNLQWREAGEIFLYLLHVRYLCLGLLGDKYTNFVSDYCIVLDFSLSLSQGFNNNLTYIIIMKILLTGGAGFIGSHTLIELTEAGHEAVVVDNLDNSSPISLKRVAKIIGKEVPFYKVDIRDREGLQKVFDEHRFDACIHFAGLKAVGESCVKPLEYYENNMNGTFVLLDVMRKNGCKNIIFSSSATVYGDPAIIPITEECPKGHCTNPYGQTKSMLEEVLMDVQKADPEWNVVLLRYFNPIGAHKSGTIGENPNGIPNNLMPYITQTAVGKRKELGVFGNDYDTHDGTGVRDYIHVVDLARAHVAALKAIVAKKGIAIYNIGTGHGYSVLDVVKAFEKVNGVHVPYSIKPRRPGDIATCYCNPAKAKAELGWEAQFGIEEMCRDSWNWQKNNPNGFEE